jgi:hypothetical protein
VVTLSQLDRQTDVQARDLISLLFTFGKYAKIDLREIGCEDVEWIHVAQNTSISLDL